MTRRKRKRSVDDVVKQNKRQKTGVADPAAIQKEPLSQDAGSFIHHPTLKLYYPEILSLRSYLLSRSECLLEQSHQSGLPFHSPLHESPKLAKLLDTTLVGIRETTTIENSKDIVEKFQSQFPNGSKDELENGNCQQSNLVDFAIWYLLGLSNIQGCDVRCHLLCRGYQRAFREPDSRSSSSRHISSRYPNSLANQFREPMWEEALSLSGKDKCYVFLHLLKDCGIFVAYETGVANYRQVSGIPLSDLTTITPMIAGANMVSNHKNMDKLAAISFMRSRMFYSSPSFNSKGAVQLGLRHIHALSRYSDSRSISHTVNLMRYIFPRQFGLHNVFTSANDKNISTQKLADYTFREKEISQKSAEGSLKGLKIPKRLRGSIFGLIREIQIRHGRCSYSQLIDYYCPPLTNSGESSSSMKKTTTSYSTPPSSVSAFVCAVIKRLLPTSFWGVGPGSSQFKRHFLQKIHEIIRLNKFESLTLHDVIQGVRTTSFPWLWRNEGKMDAKLSKTEFEKGKEILSEFLYYIFDSLVIPLVRYNFFATESQSHGKNKLFFFRHDDWCRLTTPGIETIRSRMFEEIYTRKRSTFEGGKSLGFSQVRLVPKLNGFRPIANLSRRPILKQKQGQLSTGKSINKTLEPVQKMLRLEAKNKPNALGASLFSTNEIYPRLKEFKRKLEATSSGRESNLFFAKVDVQDCFNSIPQERILQLVEKLCTSPNYRFDRHAQIKASDDFSLDTTMFQNLKALRKFEVEARPAGKAPDFEGLVNEKLKSGAGRTVFINNDYKVYHECKDLLGILRKHIQCNLVKLGGKFYRQTTGIPQGSSVSSILCNIFYGDLEAKHLNFLGNSRSVLFRMVDDFLLISTSQKRAVKFLETMSTGIADFGVSINPSKSLANFDVKIDGKRVNKPSQLNLFPYCGFTINSKTLEISKDMTSLKDNPIRDTITINPGKLTGRTFYKKTIDAFKLQTHSMLLDTDLNSLKTVARNLYHLFLSTAMKMYQHIHSLAETKRPKFHLQVRTIEDLSNAAFTIIRSRVRSEERNQFSFSLDKADVSWLAASAFIAVLRRKQNLFHDMLDWLDSVQSKSTRGSSKKRVMLRQASESPADVMRKFSY